MDSAEGDYAGSTEDNSLGRLLALSDGVFAIAMTLLALDLKVPDLPDPVTNAALLDALDAELPSIAAFLLSFYVVGNYWLAHRRVMRSVTIAHPRLIAHTMPLLALVAALPFPTSLLAEYGARPPVALTVYAVVNIVALLILLRLRRDVRRFELADEPSDPGGSRRAGWELWGNLAVFALCIPAAFLLGNNGLWVLLLLVVSGRGPGILQWLWAARAE